MVEESKEAEENKKKMIIINLIFHDPLDAMDQIIQNRKIQQIKEEQF